MQHLPFERESAILVSWREDEIGSIGIGKLADLVVFSENPLELPIERIWDVSTNTPKDLSVEYTIVGGKVEYRRDS